MVNDIYETITKLDEYQEQVNKYIDVYLKEVNKCSDGAFVYNRQYAEAVVFLAKKKIYPYINNAQNGLKEELLKRVNYYNLLDIDFDFIEMRDALYDDIKELYSLIDLDEALVIEQNDLSYIESYCITAIENLKSGHSIEKCTNYYGQIKEQIEIKANFYSLNFNKTCSESIEERGNSPILDETSMFDIKKVIAQYEGLEQPIRIDLINKFPELVQDIDKYYELYTRYSEKKDKLKDLLLKDFEPKELYYFHKFNKLVNCDDHCKFISTLEGSFICLNCFISIVFVLNQLKSFLENSNGIPSLTDEKMLKELSSIKQCLQSRKKNTSINKNDNIKPLTKKSLIYELANKGDSLTYAQIAERVGTTEQYVKNAMSKSSQK